MSYSYDGMYGQGLQPQKGDVVRCLSTAYMGLQRGDTRVVLDVVEYDRIVLYNSFSPHNKSSPYKSSNFELVSRPSTVERAKNMLARQQLEVVAKQGERQVQQYLHVAFRTEGEGFSWTELAAGISGNVLPMLPMAETSLEALKTRLKQRIEEHPNEVWVIVGGMGVANGVRRPAVDVHFRSL